MKRLGHSDIRTTMNTCSHVFPSDEAALATVFAEPGAQPVVVNLIGGGFSTDEPKHTVKVPREVQMQQQAYQDEQFYGLHSAP